MPNPILAWAQGATFTAMRRWRLSRDQFCIFSDNFRSAVYKTYTRVACVAGGFKGLGFYSEGNYGERNEKDA